MRDFNEDPNEKISGNQGFRDREASYLCYALQEIEILPTFVYSYFSGLIFT